MMEADSGQTDRIEQIYIRLWMCSSFAGSKTQKGR